MIRYTSDPVTNLDIMYKTMASVSADPNIDTSNLNIPDNDVAPSTDNQIDVPYNTVLRLPDSDPYNQLIKGFDNTVEKYNDKIHQIKSLEEKLNRLKEERAKYISQRQEKRDYYNSEGFLAKVYKYDPKTAEYLAGRMDKQTDTTLEESKIELGKTPKDRSMTIDQLRQQLRIAQGTAIDKMNATLDPDLKEQYRKEMQIYVDEAAKDYPSLQAAAIAVRDLQTKTTNEEVNASEWWKINKPNKDDISKYDSNSDGSIKDKTKFISDYKERARNAGYNSLDKTIENYVESLDADMKATVTTKKNENDRQRQIAQESEQIIIKKIDDIYPGLRKSIVAANSMFRIIDEGDSGDISARNEAVKKLSRLASDEALTGADFAQALGRTDVKNILAGLVTNITKSNVNVTADEWENIKTRLVNAINEVRNRRTAATKQIKGSDKYIEQVGTSGTTKTTGNGTGKTTGSTPNANNVKIDKNKYPKQDKKGNYYRVVNSTRIYYPN